MKITKSEIAELKVIIDRDVHMICDDNRICAALDRLAELEAAVHERRWREVTTEGTPKAAGDYEIKINGHRHETPLPANLPIDKAGFTHWRPAETDLPEA